MSLIQITPEAWVGNPFESIGKDWYLLTAGTVQTGFNTMTCSWGQMGVLWNKPAVTCYVRHSRHTFSFMEQQENFTLSFFGQDQRKALAFCGAHSGRDCDKIKEAGLTPVSVGGGVSFEGAKMVLVCKKLYAADLDPAAMPQNIAQSFYTSDAAHKMYIGEVLGMYM